MNPPDSFKHKRILKLRYVGATIGSTSVAAVASGVTITPIHVRYSASVAGGSILITLGTSGASIWRTITAAGGEYSSDLWDDATDGANKALVIEATGVVGNCDVTVSYIVKRQGAGSSGTEQ